MRFLLQYTARRCFRDGATARMLIGRRDVTDDAETWSQVFDSVERVTGLDGGLYADSAGK